MSELEQSMAALRREAEQLRMLHGELSTVREDLFTSMRAFAAAYGGNPESQLPVLLADATRHGNMASNSLKEAQAFLTVAREGIEEYVVGRGF